MKAEDIYFIAKSWIEKDHENSAVDWIKLMADDLHRRFNYELEKIGFDYYVFSKKDFFEMAKIIDSNFIGSEETFTAERKTGYYYLTTNKCDDCSCIRVFCEPRSINIDSIDRIANDTDGYEKIHKETALKVKKYVQSLVC